MRFIVERHDGWVRPKFTAQVPDNSYQGGEVITLDELARELDCQFGWIQKCFEREIKEQGDALLRAVRFTERQRAVRIIGENKGNPGAAMSEILEGGIE